jgi:pheromone shutdown-related protein TraB
LSENLIENKREYPVDVNIIEKDGREFIIIGTAHISKQSANLVREVIEKEMPDVVCVELDSQRFKALSEQKRWESLDLKTLIREKQLTTLIVNILLSSYQKKLGEKLGVMPGVELLEAANTANELGLPIELCDREIRITLRRAWNSLPFSQKFKLIFSGFAGIFEKQELTEEKLEEIRQKDVLSEMMSELGKSMPALKRVLIDERDIYITQKMKNAVGKKVVSVVGAGHVSGIIDALNKDERADLEAIEKIPPGSKLTKIIGWGIPVIIIGSIIYIGYSKGLVAAGDNALYWILANGIPSAFGALLALGHPLTVLTAFIAAPFTSLTPVIGAGYVAAFVQAYFQPPLVKEIQAATADVNQIKKWWSNKLLRIILVFILSGLGSALGTYIGAYEIISNLF